LEVGRRAGCPRYGETVISNATITRIDTQSGADAAGTPVFVTGASLTLDACLGEPTSTQHWNLGATIKDAKWALYIDKDDLAAAGITPPALGDRVYAVPEDGSGDCFGVVIHVDNEVLDLVGHYLLFLKPG